MSALLGFLCAAQLVDHDRIQRLAERQNCQEVRVSHKSRSISSPLRPKALLGAGGTGVTAGKMNLTGPRPAFQALPQKMRTKPNSTEKTGSMPTHLGRSSRPWTCSPERSAQVLATSGTPRPSSLTSSARLPPPSRMSNCAWSATTTRHKHRNVKDWLAAYPRVTMHFTSPHKLFLAEHGGDFVRPDHPPVHQAWLLRLSERPGGYDPHLHRQTTTSPPTCSDGSRPPITYSARSMKTVNT